MARMTKAKKKETKTTKGRSEEGRNESKRPRVAGKGFVGKGLTKNEQKAVAKKAAPYAALAVPGGLVAKGAAKLAGPAIKKAVAKSVEKRAIKAANAPTKGTKAKEAKGRGKEYMRDKYFTTSVRRDSSKWGTPSEKRLNPIVDKIEKASKPKQKGGSVRLNPVGQTVRKAKNVKRKYIARKNQEYKSKYLF